MSWLYRLSNKFTDFFTYLTGWHSYSEFDYDAVLEKIRNAYFLKTEKGSLHVRQIVNYLAAAIMGTGCNVKADKETVSWLKDWKTKVSFESKMLDYGRFGQLEGQILLRINVMEKNDEKIVTFNLLPWYRYKYEILYDQFGEIVGAKYPIGGGKFAEIKPEQMAYVDYSSNSGTYAPEDESKFPTVAFCMKNIQTIEDCKTAWAKLIDIFAKPTPVWITEDDQELQRLSRMLKGKKISGEEGRKWLLGEGVVTKKARLEFSQASLSGIEKISELMTICYEENSFITGIPIYLIKPEVFSNRATAEETQDGINQATITNRIKSELFIKDLLSKIAVMENQINSAKLNPTTINVSLPPNSLAQMKVLATTLATLSRERIITPETVWDMMPEIDTDVEKERWNKWYGMKKEGDDGIPSFQEEV